jgi:hypothetical protein
MMDGWEWEITLPENGRMYRASVDLLDPEQRVRFNSTARMTDSDDRRRLVRAAARQLAAEGVEMDVDAAEAKLGQRWAEHCNRRRQEPPPPDIAPAARRPAILISTQEHEINEAAAAALAADVNLFQRGGTLVRVLRDARPTQEGIRRSLSPYIEPLPKSLVRERLAACVQWFKDGKDGPEPAHPPSWCVAAVHERGHWPGVRHLEAVLDFPVLRPDGTILTQLGYDLDTGLMLEPSCTVPTIRAHPGKGSVRKALAALLEVVEDFPFARPAHEATWLALLLTPLARFGFKGPSPLFLVDSNVRGAGKGLLLSIVSMIVTGQPLTVATYTSNEEELRKRITSLAIAGDRLVLFDNISGIFGNATLDAALTATTWTDRLLGFNRTARAPLNMTWLATGNNVALGSDTTRRVSPIRLESPEERPEERTDFRHPNLLEWVASRRPLLLAAALTILRGYCAAGRPDQKLPPWGSFEGWSDLVRSAVVWAGLPDPAAARTQLQGQGDVVAADLGVILSALELEDPERRGLTTAEIVHRAFPKDQNARQPPRLVELRAAIESLVGRGDAARLGYKFRSFQRRVLNGRFLDKAGAEHQATRWIVRQAAEFASSGEDEGEDGGG